ncbi:MAG TPA: hypothetical protein VFT62_07150 [Mycobacteriales bacterium]|nr:hypothetical protein [Mycobacteriales bacterium]
MPAVRHLSPGRRRLVAVQLVVAVGGSLAAVGGSLAHAGAGCLNDRQPRNVWSRVPGPPGVVLTAIAQTGTEPCDLLAASATGAIWRSADGGASWTKASTVPARPTAIETAGLPPGTAFVVTPPAPPPALNQPGVYLTHDGGTSFVAVKGLDGALVRQVAGTGSASGRVLAVVAPPDPSAADTPLPVGAAPTVYLSTDGGDTFTPEPATAGLNPTSLAVNAATGDIWLASAGGGGSVAGLFLSTNGGMSFTPQRFQTPSPPVTAVAVSPIAGGGSLTLAGTPGALWAGVGSGGVYGGVNGTSWQKADTATTFPGVAFEYDHPFTFMTIAGRQIHRVDSSARGYRVHNASAGLPAGCVPTGLTRDTSSPSTFLITCNGNSFYRYRSDGADLSSVDTPFPPPLTLPAGPPQASIPMRVLRTLRIPVGGSADSAAVAFDGRSLYLADENAPGSIYRLSPVTGRYEGELHVPIPAPVATLTYDALRDLIYVEDTNGNIYSYDLRRHTATFMFFSPVAQRGGDVGSFSYDPSTDRFVGADDQDDTIREFTRSGVVTSRCSVPDVPVDTNPGGAGQPGDAGPTGVAAVVATGDGQMYAEMEDDKTVYRLDRSCHVFTEYVHRTYAEAPDENDSMACDTVTFPVPAIWMRDSGLDAVQAYAVPNGYCALATRLSLPRRVDAPAGSTKKVCASLTLAGARTPLARQRIEMFVRNKPLGSAVTDLGGRACVPYRAPARSPRRPASGGHGASAPLAIVQPVLGVYVGTSAYRPATGRSALVTTEPAVRRPAVRRPPATAAAAVALAGPPPQQPPPAPPAATKPQPVAQGNPGAQPGVVSQPGAAAHREEQAESAVQTAEEATEQTPAGGGEHLYRELGGASGTLPAGLVGLTLAAVGLELRRRRSRVREQTVL